MNLRFVEAIYRVVSLKNVSRAAEKRLITQSARSRRIAPKFVTHALDAIGVTVLLVEQNLRHALSIAHPGHASQTGRIVMQGSGSELAGNDDVKKADLGL
jgi:branched-chain amino acid transport system ATP-binding protein